MNPSTTERWIWQHHDILLPKENSPPLSLLHWYIWPFWDSQCILVLILWFKCCNLLSHCGHIFTQSPKRWLSNGMIYFCASTPAVAMAGGIMFSVCLYFNPSFPLLISQERLKGISSNSALLSTWTENKPLCGHWPLAMLASLWYCTWAQWCFTLNAQKIDSNWSSVG